MVDEDFHLACELGPSELVSSMLERGVPIELRSKFTHETGLHRSAVGDCPAIVQLLLDCGADPNARDAFLRTPLHRVCPSSDGALSQLLLDRGADVNARAQDGSTPLHVAIKSRHRLPVVAVILEAGGDINLENEDGETPLGSLASVLPSHNCVFVIEHVLRLQEASYAVSKKNGEVLKTLIRKIEYDETTFRQRCAAELRRMKSGLLEPTITLHEVLDMQDEELIRKIARNKFLKRLVKDEVGLNMKYPIYGYLLRRQYQRGIKKRIRNQKRKQASSRDPTASKRRKGH